MATKEENTETFKNVDKDSSCREYICKQSNKLNKEFVAQK